MKCLLTAITLIIVLGAIPATAEDTIQVHLAGADWAVEIPGGGLQVNPRATNIADATARIVAADPTTGLNCSLDVLPAEMEGGGVEARMAYISRNKKRMGMSELKEDMKGEFAIL